MDDWLEINRLRSRQNPFGSDDEVGEVLAWISALHVETAHDRAFDSYVRRAISQTHGNERAVLVVDGPGHLGKSWTAMNWAIGASGLSHGRLPPRANGARQIPVCIVEADATTKVPGLMANICVATGLPDSGNERVLRRRLDERLPLLGTSVVIVDDVHMLKQKSSNSTSITDGLRALLRLRTTFVFVMTDTRFAALSRLRDDLNSDASVAQIRARRIDLPLRPWRLPDDRDACRNAMRSFAVTARRAVPSLDFSALKDKATVNDLVDGSRGIQGVLFAVLKSATCDAIREHRGDVSRDLIERRLGERSL